MQNAVETMRTTPAIVNTNDVIKPAQLCNTEISTNQTIAAAVQEHIPITSPIHAAPWSILVLFRTIHIAVIELTTTDNINKIPGVGSLGKSDSLQLLHMRQHWWNSASLVSATRHP